MEFVGVFKKFPCLEQTDHSKLRTCNVHYLPAIPVLCCIALSLDAKASPLHAHKKALISWLFSALGNNDLALGGDAVVAIATMLDVPGCLCQDEVCASPESQFLYGNERFAAGLARCKCAVLISWKWPSLRRTNEQGMVLMVGIGTGPIRLSSDGSLVAGDGCPFPLFRHECMLCLGLMGRLYQSVVLESLLPSLLDHIRQKSECAQMLLVCKLPNAVLFSSLAPCIT